ncbi:predicted protein, partial [Nematostella vectensis]
MESLYNFVAGWFGGCAGVIVGQPLDTVKVRMQATGKLPGNKQLSSWKCFTGIIKNESVFGLFKGMASPLSMLAFQNAVIFCVHSTILERFQYRRPDGSNTIGQIAFAGSVAGLAQVPLIAPVDLVKIKLQMQTEAILFGNYANVNFCLSAKRSTRSVYRGPVDCLVKLYRSRGLAGCFQGNTVTAVRDIPGFAVYFGVYELLCDWFSNLFGSRGVATYLMAGGFAGVVSWASTFPFDVIKSRIQADGNLGKFRYKGMMDCALQSYKEEGMIVFTRGIWPTLLRGFPSSAAIF